MEYLQETRGNAIEGTCGAFFIFQRVKAESLLTGSWHKSQWTREAYASGADGDGEAAEGKDGEGGGGGDEDDGSDNGDNSKHSYKVPTLQTLPDGLAPKDRVIALTAFRVHTPHPAEIAQSQSTNTLNVPASASRMAASNNTCKCVPCPLPPLPCQKC